MAHVLEFLVRRRCAFLLGATVAACALLLSIPWAPVEYTASACLDVTDAPLLAAEAALSPPAPADFRDAVAGRPAVEHAADALGLTAGLPRGSEAVAGPRAAAIDDIARRVSASETPRTDGIRSLAVACTHRSAEVAVALPNELVRAAADRLASSMRARLEDRRNALRARAAQARASLAQAQDRQARFENSRAATLPANAGVLQQQAHEIRSRIDALTSRSAAARQQMEHLESALPEKPAASDTPREIVRGPNPALAQLLEQLAKSQSDLTTAMTVQNMTAEHPEVQKLRARIEVLRTQIAATPGEVILSKVYGPERADNSVIVQMAAVQAEIDTATLQIAALQKQLAEVRDALAQLGPTRQEHQQILKEVEAQEAASRQADADLAEADRAASTAAGSGPVRDVRPARDAGTPSFPRLWHALAAALAAGLLAGGAAALVAHRMDRTVATPEEAAARFGVPVLGVVDEIVSVPRRALRAAGRWTLRSLALAVLATAVALAAMHAALWLHDPPRYDAWKSDPPGFVARHVRAWAGETGLWP
jgi:uncharacterized protein involved in exopolysaccharide biosynthesis